MVRLVGALLGALLASGAIAQERVIAIDGDTIAVGAERIRIIGMDAPEIFTLEKCSTPEETRRVLMLGYAGQGRLQNLLNVRRVRIEREGWDKYGRTLARVYVGRDDVAHLMIAEGWARPYKCPGRRCPARQPWCG